MTPCAPTACPAAGAPALPAVPQQEQQPSGPEDPAVGLRLRARLGGGCVSGEGSRATGAEPHHAHSQQGRGVPSLDSGAIRKAWAQCTCL